MLPEPAWTASIHTPNQPALREKDHRIQVELRRFITGDVEEEKNAVEIMQQLELINGRGTTVLTLDHRLGKRGE